MKFDRNEQMRRLWLVFPPCKLCEEQPALEGDLCDECLAASQLSVGPAVDDSAEPATESELPAPRPR